MSAFRKSSGPTSSIACVTARSATSTLPVRTRTARKDSLIDWPSSTLGVIRKPWVALRWRGWSLHGPNRDECRFWLVSREREGGFQGRPILSHDRAIPTTCHFLVPKHRAKSPRAGVDRMPLQRRDSPGLALSEAPLQAPETAIAQEASWLGLQ